MIGVGAVIAVGDRVTAGAEPAPPGTPAGGGVTVSQYDPGPAPAPTAAEAARLHAKHQKALQHFAVVEQRSKHAAAAKTAGTLSAAEAAALTSSNLSVAYQSQQLYYYCGPATAAMIARFIGVAWSGTSRQQQDAAASLMRTTQADGTAWYGYDNVPNFQGGSMYPMADALDYRLYLRGWGAWYMGVNVSGTPTSAQKTGYVQDLTYDVDASYPLALNQWSIAGYQLPYQPYGAWQHWLVGRGYASSGGLTIVNDPGWTAGNNASVPSTDTSKAGDAGSITSAIGGHGYVW